MNTRKYCGIAAAMAVAVPLALASCGDDDAPSGPGLDFGEKSITGYRTEYALQLADPNVREVADVQVEYYDADGSMKKDTLEDGAWTKTVVYAPGKDRVYALSARYLPKAAPVATHDTYDFAVSLRATVDILYSNGTNMRWATARNHTYKGILAPNEDGEFSTVRSASYLLSTYGREEMDTTGTYFNITYRELPSGKDTLIYNNMAWE